MSWFGQTALDQLFPDEEVVSLMRGMDQQPRPRRDYLVAAILWAQAVERQVWDPADGLTFIAVSSLLSA